MYFTIEKDVFLRGLGRVQGIVERKTTLPILSNVLIVARDGEIGLTATDLEVGLNGSYAATVKTPGKITVAAKKLHEIIKELPDGEVSFRAKENSWIEIRCGKAIFNIVGLAAEEFPYFPELGRERFIEIKAADLKEMIEKTLFSVSTDESKYNLNGIYFRAMTDENNREVLRLVATDGHRLALIQRPLNGESTEELRNGVIFPRKGCARNRRPLLCVWSMGISPIITGSFPRGTIVSARSRRLIFYTPSNGWPFCRVKNRGASSWRLPPACWKFLPRIRNLAKPGKSWR